MMISDMGGAAVSAFALPAGMIGRFAIVKLWPELKTAEDECIARLKLAAAALGLECIEIHFDGRPIAGDRPAITSADVDFVIHLHYDTPKCYDAFSLVALWNPMRFYHEWGYQRTTRNLMSHDDFLSCSSDAADAHVARLARKVATHLPPTFKLYHSTPDLMRGPSLGDGQLFYVGINWEAVNGGKSRHQEVLRRMDSTGFLRLYGPEVFMGVKVWDGYRSYVKEIPFDGVSMIDEIAKAGISLVLSSKAHKESALMSNRLFESIAAGALIICDENPFAQKHFGDALLYVDTRCSVDQIHDDILRHINWARSHPEVVLEMIARTQKIFSEKFALVRNLADLYAGLDARKLALASRQGLIRDRNGPHFTIYFLCSDRAKNVGEQVTHTDSLARHVASAQAQTYPHCDFVFIVNPEDAQRASTSVALLGDKARLLPIAFDDVGPTGLIDTPRRVGEVLHELWAAELRTPIESTGESEYFAVVAPNERLLSNHVSVLAGCAIRHPEAHCLATAVIPATGNKSVHHVDDRLDFGFFDPKLPIGFARFGFSRRGVAEDIELALPYLDKKAIAAFVANHEVHQEVPATVLIDTLLPYPNEPWNQGMENELLADYCPNVFTLRAGLVADPLSRTERPDLTPVALPMRRFSLRWAKYQVASIQKSGISARFVVMLERLRIVRPAEKGGEA